MTTDQWDFLADAVNPTLLVVFLGITYFKFPQGHQRVRSLAPFALALLITWLIAHLDHWIPALRHLAGFPSGHMAFFGTVATSLALLIPISVAATLPLGILYGWLIVFLNYHVWWDLLTAIILSLSVTLVCHRWLTGQK